MEKQLWVRCADLKKKTNTTMKNGIILKKDIFAVPKMGMKIEQQFCSTEEFSVELLMDGKLLI